MKKILITFFVSLFVFCFISRSSETMFAQETVEDIYYTQQLVAANYLASQGFIADNYANPENYRFDDTITRKEMMKIIAKIAGLEVSDICEGVFSDVSNDWGCKYIESAFDAGFIELNEGIFRPNDNVSKSEALKLIFKALEIQKNYNTDNWQEDYMKTAYDLNLSFQYSDYNASALRGWIFLVIARTSYE